MSLSTLPTEVVEMVLCRLNTHDVSSVARVNKTLNHKSTLFLYKNLSFRCKSRWDYKTPRELLVSYLLLLAKTFNKVPGRALSVRSLEIEWPQCGSSRSSSVRKLDEDEITAFSGALGLLLELRTLNIIIPEPGRWSVPIATSMEIRNLQAYSQLKELHLKAFDTSYEDALGIIQFPVLQKLTIDALTHDQEAPTGPDDNIHNHLKGTASKPTGLSQLRCLKLGQYVELDWWARELLRCCHSLESFEWDLFHFRELDYDHLGVFPKLLLPQVLAPLAGNIKHLKIIVDTSREPHNHWEASFPAAFKLDLSAYLKLEVLDVDKGSLFLSREDLDGHEGFNVEVGDRDDLFLQLPNSLQVLKIRFPLNSSVVDGRYAGQEEQRFTENCRWINELALHKSDNLQSQYYEMVYLFSIEGPVLLPSRNLFNNAAANPIALDLREIHLRERTIDELTPKTKSWNPPQKTKGIYKKAGIKLQVHVRPLSLYERIVEQGIQQQSWLRRFGSHDDIYTHSFTPSPTRDVSIPGDMYFTVQEPELSTPQDATVKAALEAFSRKMRSNNRKFLADRISEIKNMNPNPQTEAEVDLMARYWIEGIPESAWPAHNYRTELLDHPAVSNNWRTLWSADNTVNKTEDIANLEHPLLDGINPGESHARPEWDRDQITDLELFLNRESYISEKFGPKRPVRVNDEFISFVKYAPRGVKDPDFRKSGVCEFYPQRMFDYHGKFDSPEGPWNPGRWFHFGNQEVDIQSWCLTGKGRKHGEWNAATSKFRPKHYWSSYYVLCRKREPITGPEDWEEPTQFDEENGWFWRVLFFERPHDVPKYKALEPDGSMSNDLASQYNTYLFDTIVEFLEWYGSWYDRLDMDAVREDTEPQI